MALSQYEPVLQIVERGGAPLTPDARFMVFRSRVARHLRGHRLELGALPDVADAILHQGRWTTRDATAVARSIWRDPALAEQTLTIVNSPWFGPTRPVSDLRAAIYRLGVARVRGVVLAAALEQSLFDVLDFEEEGAAAWRHAVATAIVARELAQRDGTSDPERAFLAGLFHSVGYGGVLKACAEVCRLHLTRAERRESHVRAVASELQAEVGSFMARRWRLDDGLVEVIATFERPGDACIEPELAHVVSRARAIVATAGVTPWPTGASVYGRPQLTFAREPEGTRDAVLDVLPHRMQAYTAPEPGADGPGRGDAGPPTLAPVLPFPAP